MVEKVTTRIFEEFKAGREDACTAVFNLYSSKLILFVEKTVKSRSEAEEIAQDSFCALWQNREKIETPSGLKNYLFSIAFNNSADYIKRKIRERNFMENEKYVADFITDIDNEIELLELSALLRMVVSQMPEQRQKVFRMSREESLTNDQIAATLDISKKTVYRHIDMALKDVRKILMGLLLLIQLNV